MSAWRVQVVRAEGRLFDWLNTLPTALGDRAWRHWRNAELAAVPLSAAAARAVGRRRLTWQLLVGGLAAEVAGKALKRVLHRRRPAAARPSAIERGGSFEGPALPSDHVAIAAALLGVAAPHLGGPARLTGAFVVAAAAMERVHIGAHRPLDVVAGGVLGTAVARVVRSLV